MTEGAREEARPGSTSPGRMPFWRGVQLEPDARRAFRAELEQAAIDRLRVFSVLLLVLHVGLLIHDVGVAPAAPGSAELRWQHLLLVMHLAMAAATTGVLVAFRWLRERRSKAFVAYLMTAFFLSWGAVLAGVDQLIGAGITVYLIVNLACALFVTFERLATFVAFGVSMALFVAGQLTFAGTPALAFSQWVNGASFALTCVFFSRMLYAAKTRDFWQRETIARQNAELSAANDKLADERAKSESLLHAALPPRIVERLKHGEARIADAHPAVTVLWADLCGFTELASALSPADLVGLLDELFSSFDAVVHAFGLEKIKTVGDGYLAVAGIAEPNDLDVVAAAGAGLALHRAVAEVSERRGRALALRVGIARGQAMAGVLGRERLLYDIWGDVVNVAARLETAARPGETLITSDAARSIADTYALGPDVALDVKGKGTMSVRAVITRRGSPTSVS